MKFEEQLRAHMQGSTNLRGINFRDDYFTITVKYLCEPTLDLIAQNHYKLVELERYSGFVLVTFRKDKGITNRKGI